MPQTPSLQTAWTLVVPVKGGPGAKSRLGGSAALALAMSLDCVDAALGAQSVSRVVVVSADEHVREQAARLGAEVVVQGPRAPGLAAAVLLGIEHAASTPGPTAVLLGDLPAVRGGDLDAALAVVGRSLAQGAVSVLVPDAEGTGTVLLAAASPRALRPSFGPGSAARHAQTGASRLDLAIPALRRDVDTPQDLAAALRLGVGARTRRTLRGMQATVLSYDADRRSGEVVTDDGLRLPMTQDAMARSGLRHLRPGQRVSCDAVLEADEMVAVAAVRITGIDAD